MSKPGLTEEGTAHLLAAVGRTWRQEEPAELTPAERARAHNVLQRALALLETGHATTPVERVASLLNIAVERLHSPGGTSAEGLGRAPGSDLAETKVEAGWWRTVLSDDRRVQGTLQLSGEGEVSITFQTRCPELAGAPVVFALAHVAEAQPLHSGRLALEPLQSGLWGAHLNLGPREKLGGKADLQFLFAVEDEA